MVMVQWMTAGETPVTLFDVSQPVAGVVEPVPSALSQVIVALVSPDPPSRKLTWISESGGLVKTAAVAVGSLAPQSVPFETVTSTFVWLAPPYPDGGEVSLTV